MIIIKGEYKLKKIVFIIILVICICLGIIGYYYDKKHEEKIVKYDNPFIGYYGISNTIDINDSKVIYYDQLYLRDDGSFYLSKRDKTKNNIIVGTYKVYNNEITFSDEIIYSNDDCFSKTSNKYVANVIDGNIVIKDKEYIKNMGTYETKTNRSYYVVNPIEGNSPENIGNKWISCSNKKIVSE